MEKPIFHLATLFARREAKTRIWQRDWLKLAGEKIRREQVGSVSYGSPGGSLQLFIFTFQLFILVF